MQPAVLIARGSSWLRWHHPELGAISPGEFIPLVGQTALTLAEPDFTRHLMEALEEHGLEAQALELEFTESALMRDWLRGRAGLAA